MIRKILIIWGIVCSALLLCSCQELIDEFNRQDEKSKNKDQEKVSELSNKETLSDEDVDNGSIGKIDFTSAEVGDVVIIGSYEQDDDETDGKEPLEWIVLYKQDDKILLFSKNAIDSINYSGKGYKGHEWEDSYLRVWLNDNFYKNAFNHVEKDAIIETVVLTDGHPSVVETRDNIFVLSKKELCNPEYGFPEDEHAMPDLREATITTYAYNKIKTNTSVGQVYRDLYINEEKDNPNDYTCYYWARETGKRDKKGRSAKVYDVERTVVSDLGFIMCGFSFDYCICVRPAMWVKTN